MGAMRAGRFEDAARGWERVLSVAPAHPQALMHLGQYALVRNDVARARALMERAANAAPQDPVIAFNCAYVYRAGGDVQAEAAALDRALALDPYCYPALLAKGALVERRGDKRMAARLYKDFFKIAPPLDQLPRELQAQAEQAKSVVREDGDAFAAYLDDKLGALRARQGNADASRFDECREIALGRKKVYVQQPTGLHYPKLPALGFYDRELFPWLGELEAQTPAIVEELRTLAAQDDAGFSPYVAHPAGSPLNQWAELNHSPKWSAWFFWKNGVRQNEHCARCPKTAAAAEAAPLIRIPGHAPAVFFSSLQPHTRIPAHSGVTNTRVIVHLPLIVPKGCHFRVGNDMRPWHAGEAWVFDDTIEHEAWNDSDRLRVILILDVWNPFLSEAERELAAGLTIAMHDYYGGGESPLAAG